MSVSDFSDAEKQAILEEIEQDREYVRDWTGDLWILARDADPAVRARAIRAMWEHVDDRSLPDLTRSAEEDPSPEVRAEALRMLGRFLAEWEPDAPEDADAHPSRETLIGRLLAVWSSAGREVLERIAALEALGYAGSDGRVCAAISESYGRSELAWKLAAVFAMGRTGDPRWDAQILSELDSPVRELRLEAARAAGEAALEQAEERLAILCRDGDPELRVEAVYAIGKAAGERAEPLLSELCQDEDPQVAAAAEAALWELAASGDSE